MPQDEPTDADGVTAERLAIVVDDREARCGLPQALAARWPCVAVGRLAVGDVAIGPDVLVERKAVADLVRSLADGRLFSQAYALTGATYRPLMIVEGSDGGPLMELSPRVLRAALLTLMVSYRIPVLRTDDVEETSDVLAHLAQRETRRRSRPGRRGDRDRVRRPARAAVEMLGAIPGVGDIKARTMLDAFGSVRATLQADEAALRDLRGIGPTTARAVRTVGGGRDRGEGRAEDATRPDG